MLHELSGRRLLMLQGPVGPFFRRIADELEASGASVTKINFNGGDDLYFRRGHVLRFNRPLSEWPAYLQTLVVREKFEAVLLFGDCRPIHRVAISALKASGIDVYVFEEGYLRPDFVTLEKDGVNGHSSMSRDPDFYRQAGLLPCRQSYEAGQTTPYAIVSSASYAIASGLLRSRYPHYAHHKSLNFPVLALQWCGAILRKLGYTWPERRVMRELARNWEGRYFLAPLQVNADYQLTHSSFPNIAAFIEQVVASFAEHAPSDVGLVLKHHPMDRAYSNYSALVRELTRRHRLSGRLWYVHDLHLPTLLRRARGTVLINSTVGLSSIHHGTPVKCLGRSVYDLPGLTFQGELAEFWKDPGAVDHELYLHFRGWLEAHNQLNDNVWKPRPRGADARARGADARGSSPSLEPASSRISPPG